jgi:putative salt-induced outer membrane protein YdiY
MISSTLLPFFLAAAGASDAPMPVEPKAAEPTPQTSEAEEDTGWTGNVTAGATLATGNSDNRTATLTGNAVWNSKPERVTIGALWNYQDDDSGVTQRKVYGSAQYDHFLSEPTFYYVNTSADHDLNAALDLRLTGGVGMGHQFVQDDTWNLNGEVGLSYIDENYGVTADDPTGEAADSDYFAARLAYTVDYLASDHWELSHNGQIYPSVEDSDDVYARWDTRVKTNLTEAMFAQLQWIWDYDNTPAPGAKRNDNLFTLTVGWSF